MLALVLWIAALLLFILAAIPVAIPRVNLTAAGLACATAAYLITAKGL